MSNVPNFRLLFERIGDCLAKGQKASKADRKVAKDAWLTIVKTIYGGDTDWKCLTQKPYKPPF